MGKTSCFVKKTRKVFLDFKRKVSNGRRRISVSFVKTTIRKKTLRKNSCLEKVICFSISDIEQKILVLWPKLFQPLCYSGILRIRQNLLGKLNLGKICFSSIWTLSACLFRIVLRSFREGCKTATSLSRRSY